MNNNLLDSTIARWVSFAFVIAIIILFVFMSPWTLGEYKTYPNGSKLLVHPVGAKERSFLMMAVLMVPSALCHGFGLKGHRLWTKILLHPLVIWSLMIIGIGGALYLT